MTGAIIILLVTVFVGLLLYVYDLKYRNRRGNAASPEGRDNSGSMEGNDESESSSDTHGEICCGRHLVCDKKLSPDIDEKPVYYDDEELDRFAGKDADSYSPDEIEEVREVMMTLLPEDVPGWVRSIQLRGINLPSPLRDELFILLECN